MMQNEKQHDLINFHRKERDFHASYLQGFRALAQSYHLSGLEVDVLFSLYHDGSCDSITKICRDIGKTKGVVSKACEHLTQLSYLSSKSDEEDRRIIHFRLTASARTIIASFSRYVEAMKDTQSLRQFLAEQSHSFQKDPWDKTLLQYPVILRADLKKGWIYPVKSSIFFNKDRLELPFYPYNTFWQNFFADLLHTGDADFFKEKMASALLQKQLTENNSSLKKNTLLFSDGVFQRYIFEIQGLDTENENALILINTDISYR